MTEGLCGSGDDDQPGGTRSVVRYLYPPPAAAAAYEFNGLLSRLVGYHLQSIQFTGGYVQFGFDSTDLADDPVLTCEVMPVVDARTGPIACNEPGYADALRALIGEHVIATSEAPYEGVRVEFAESALRLRPTTGQLVGPAIAMLSDFADGGSVSWRPGGEAFEYLD